MHPYRNKQIFAVMVAQTYDETKRCNTNEKYYDVF
jgi:hypothetical protein